MHCKIRVFGKNKMKLMNNKRSEILILDITPGKYKMSGGVSVWQFKKTKEKTVVLIK